MLKFILIYATILIMSITSTIAENAYSFGFDAINGKKLNIKDYEGKVVLIVNTASRCGFTKQYAGLQELWESYEEKGLIILGVPSNSFMQELNDSKSVSDFCEANFGIDFPMTKITKVIGDDKHPFYKWLKENHDITPRWNFHKIMISPKGEVINSYSSLTKPKSKKILDDLKKHLNI